MPWTGPDTSDEAPYATITFPTDPPGGYGPPGVVRFRCTLATWAKAPEVQKAWAKIAEKHGLPEKKLREFDRVFGFADLLLALTYSNS
jgi:hypothetical protein